MSQLAEKVMNRFRLDGKTAVVTGGAGNIGSHGAAAFAEAGADIAIVDLPVCIDRAKAVAEDLSKKYGVKALAYGCNVNVLFHGRTVVFVVFYSDHSALCSDDCSLYRNTFSTDDTNVVLTPYMHLI